MKPSQRRKIYRERRRRAARRRRCLASLGESILNRIQTSFAEKPPEIRRKEEVAFHRALSMITGRAYAYSLIAGLLYKCDGKICRVCIIAPRPMTKPIALISRSWSGEISRICPQFHWVVSVSPSPPDQIDGYECVFWRTATLKASDADADFFDQNI